MPHTTAPPGPRNSAHREGLFSPFRYSTSYPPPVIASSAASSMGMATGLNPSP